MLRIEISGNLDYLLEKHYNGVEKYCKDRISFLLDCLSASGANNNDIEVLKKNKLAAKTKSSLVNLLLTQEITKYSEYNLLINPANYKNTISNNSNNLIIFFQYLLNNKNLKRIIIGKPDILHTEEYNALNIIGINNINDDIKKIISKIFYFDDFHNFEEYNSYTLIENLKLNTCVYCNRQYTSYIKNITKPSIDHFYDKGQHPLLGLSFYNLIPSCDLCNSRFKHKKPFSVQSNIHPHKEGFDEDAKFDYKFEQLNPNISDPSNFKILLRNSASTPKWDRIDKNIKVFKLEEIYQVHRDVVGEIYLKTDENSQYYLGDVISRHQELKSNFGEIYRFYFGNYYEKNDHHKRPLAKLTRDIFDRQSFLNKLKLKK